MSIYVTCDFTCILSVILHFGFAECGFHAGKQKHCECLLLPTTWSVLLTATNVSNAGHATYDQWLQFVCWH